MANNEYVDIIFDPSPQSKVFQRADPVEMNFPCYRCGTTRVPAPYTMCKDCMDSITNVKKEDVEKALQSVTPSPNAPKEAVSTIKPDELENVFVILPAYRTVSDERKSRVLFLLRAWAEGELRQLHHIHQKVKPDNLTPAEYKDWLYKELKEVDKMLAKEILEVCK